MDVASVSCFLVLLRVFPVSAVHFSRLGLLEPFVTCFKILWT